MNTKLRNNNIRVAVAMSGGVDSSVVAALLSDQGYQVFGLTMQLYNNQTKKSSKSCCAGQDIYDAKYVADKIGIPHYVLDYEDKFRDQVINPFIKSYKTGETPIPCILCNQTVKFSDLICASKEIGADFLATGHYIQKVVKDNQVGMYRAKDKSKDQSYFLFSTKLNQLEYLTFPLGKYNKKQTRDLAKKYGLSVAHKPDSQDICFVTNGKYKDFIDSEENVSNKKGKIVNIHDQEIGDHSGIENFTVGQRRGIGVGGLKNPLYVVAIDTFNNKIIVGPKHTIAKKEISLRDVNWLYDKDSILRGNLDIDVKVRNTQDPISAKIMLEGNTGKIKVYFNEPLVGVSPGQACVFYKGDRVLGGGWIEKDKFDFIPHNKKEVLGSVGASL